MPRLLSRPLALLLAAPAVAPAVGHAQDPAAEAAPAAAVRRIVGYQVTGGIDPPGQLEAVITRMAPLGSPYVDAGPADDEGIPISTEGRLQRALERLGYHAVIQPGPASGGVQVLVTLRPYDRVRQIFVRGNWPLRQDEIVRRLSLRPGQPLPLPGPEREARIERERLSVLTFLRDQGYLEAQVALEVRVTDKVPSPIDLVIRIELGPGYPVGEVRTQGNTAVSSADIADQLRHLDWRFLWSRPVPFKLSLLRDDLQALTLRYRELGYAGALVRHDYDPLTSVDPGAKNVRLGIAVREGKKVEVQFEGNRRIDDADLKDRLTIFTRGSYDSFEADASADAIAQLYRSKGFMFARVTWRLAPAAQDVQRLIFTVAEGPSLKVRGVEFVGNRAFSNGRLGEVVTVRDFPLLGFIGLGEGGYASFLQLELDVERLQSFYEDSGHPGTKARCEIAPQPGRWQAPSTVREDDPSWKNADALYVRFTVEEAPRVDVSEVTFQARPGEQLPYDNAFLGEAVGVRPGDPFRPAGIRGDVERLRRLLGEAGYPQATAEPSVTIDGTRARVVWELGLGPRLRVGELFVRGNFLTRPSTITRWTLLRPGDLLTTTAAERSQRNLALVQLFNNATPIAFPPEAQAGEVVPMVVDVEERHDHWGIVRVGGGASTEQAPPDADVPIGFYAAAGYEHRNLFGQGWTVLSRAELGNSVTRANADFIDPRFLGTPFRLEVGGNYLRQATVRLGDIRSGGGSIGLARELYPGVDAAVRYNLRNTFRTEFLVRAAGPDAEQETVRIGTMVGSGSFSIEWQRLDNPLVPTRGFKLQGGVELALPGLSFGIGSATFVKASLRSLAVVPLLQRLSLRHSVRLDQGFPMAGASLLPKVERYFAGGDTTIRGFELDRARTDVTTWQTVSGVRSSQFRPIGGSLRILSNLDLQVQIAGGWFGAVFIDNGVVADSLSGLRPEQFRHGVGVAPLLFKLPVGDLSVSWAWPLDPQPGDSRIGRLHFNVGLLF